MKCLVLAGGSSDRLWPLSRKNYPKQFMEIRRGRSMFQEAILRNMPFCDEFIIITNRKYENIVQGQLQDFQGLKYTVLIEEIPLKTALSVALVALRSQEDEELLIVSTDHLIEGEYNACMMQVKETVKKDKVAVVVVKPRNHSEGYHFISSVNKKIVLSSHRTKNSYWDCGIFAGKVSVFLQSLDESFVEQMKKVQPQGNILTKDILKKVRATSLASVLRTEQMQLVQAKFELVRITDISSYYNYFGKAVENNSNTIGYHNKNVEIVNMVQDQLVVANGLRNIIIANTRDAIYITPIDQEADIKTVAKKYYLKKSRYFDECSIYYEKWGTKEILNQTQNCVVSRITVYQNQIFKEEGKRGRILNYFVVEGSAKIYSEENGAWDCGLNGSVTFHAEQNYEIANEGKGNLVLIQTDNIGGVAEEKEIKRDSCLVKMIPALKDSIWGGTKIRDVLKKDVGTMKRISESWELSAHPAGESVIGTGEYGGMTFSEFIKAIGEEQLGWKAQGYETFPLMIKFIDAKESLSIQVHPDDEYAFPVEGDYGKNEMWYVLEADEGACIYDGFNRNVTEKEIRERIKNNTLLEVLNAVPVKKGETFFLHTGTVHAIGAGCLICEVQQSSNVTYRLYDYGRKDADGNTRELHLEKALDVLNTEKMKSDPCEQNEVCNFEGYTKQLLGQCKYFAVNKYEIEGELALASNESSFKVIVVIEGNGTITNGEHVFETKFGDTWFCGCRDVVQLCGNLKILAVSV